MTGSIRSKRWIAASAVITGLAGVAMLAPAPNADAATGRAAASNPCLANYICIYSGNNQVSGSPIDGRSQGVDDCHQFNGGNGPVYNIVNNEFNRSIQLFVGSSCSGTEYTYGVGTTNRSNPEFTTVGAYRIV